MKPRRAESGVHPWSSWATKIASALLFVAAALPAAHAQQQAWPAQPLRLVVPYPPAGAADVAARVIGQRLAARLGQPVVVDNHPGAVGTIGASLVAKAPADGYTLLAATNPEITIVRHLRASLPYKPDDLVPLLRTAQVPIVLVTRGEDAQSAHLQQVLERAKRTPDKLSYATPGVGTPMHLMMESILQASGVRVHHIPYNGGSRAVADLIGGQVDMLAISLSTVMSHLQSGRLRALAVLQAERSALAPNVPSLREAGGVSAPKLPSVWFGWFAPAQTPLAVRARLAAELESIVREPEIKLALERGGLEASPLQPQPFARELRDESNFFAGVAKPFAER
ncbi:tripartite tricarboxylate transporter substrate binding protein [Ottowia sp.]|uniref:tripartite tricarboxylate transporter substrate binding protein n=1 Tax=Ottowia sp. TaxID=1898956 RepID=UPI003C70C9C1